MTVANEEWYHTQSLYLDVEQAFWTGPPPPGMKQDIIEIGIVEMDLTTLEMKRPKSFFVRPRRWEISDACTQLTGITAGDIQTARPFPEVLASLTEEFSPSKHLCCTWGDDADVIAKTSLEFGLRTPLRNLLDLARLFRQLLLFKQQPSLGNAIEMLGIQFDGVPHTAMADAINTAHVHAALIRRMRQQPAPSPLPARQAAVTTPVTGFGEKLSQALGAV